MARLNKKILCFVDEYGTAGEPGFALGCVIVWARECGRLDKTFSDLLPASVNEVHAADWEKEVVQGVLGRLKQATLSQNMILLNKPYSLKTGSRPEIYANALVETVKFAIKRFRAANRGGRFIGNVEVIVDACEQNTDLRFLRTIEKARLEDGLFKAVIRVVTLDSAASRVLQLADLVAHARSWIVNGEENAKGLRDTYGIEVS
ncbi:hypothetical protein CJ014_11710 [Pleomorphomonas carboxyditropha]|uniref:DUF3800 domain-containing protein n=2 Tax=Pleomorphomonas carboxyditropha TaxID=2023338 RepID=A0A2G9WWT4_9HYPH|nr:hypothetical protein CJ014_11710 [Pleomorphomonas carboxyditropha]